MQHNQSIEFQKLLTDTAKRLNEGDCDGLRFALVIWCDCIDVPMFAGSNDSDVGTVLSMIARAAENMATASPKFIGVDSETAGNA